MSGIIAWAQLLVVPVVVLLVIVVIAWRQDRRRPSTRYRGTGLGKMRWGHGSVSRSFGQPEGGGSSRSSGAGPGQGAHDRPTYLD